MGQSRVTARGRAGGRRCGGVGGTRGAPGLPLGEGESLGESGEGRQCDRAASAEGNSAAVHRVRGGRVERGIGDEAVEAERGIPRLWAAHEVWRSPPDVCTDRRG